MGAQTFQFAPKFPQNGRLSVTKQPKISQSCAKVALHGKSCAVARKRESCAPQHHNFLGGLNNYISCIQTRGVVGQIIKVRTIVPSYYHTGQ